MTENENTVSIEEGFGELDELLNRLEADDITLEDSFALYEKGVGLIKDMHGKLEDLSARVEKLTADGSLVPFEAEE